MDRKTWRRLIPLVLLAVAALSSCLSNAGATMVSFTEAAMFGKAYDYDQKPCPGARIIVDGKEGPLTDVSGRFVLDPLKRGKHEIVVRKEGYEELATRIEFLSTTQVLYLRVVSEPQLVHLAEQAIRERKWSDAQGYLDRARGVVADDPVEKYLSAILLMEQGEPRQAVQALERLVGSGFRDPTVYLTLADIYQYRLGDDASARRSLEQFLKMRDDPEARKRLADLAATQPAAP
jgi:tetratricopeptide (TPR) repeat protein